MNWRSRGNSRGTGREHPGVQGPRCDRHRRKPTVVAKVAGISRQALYRPIARRPAGAGPGRGRPGDEAIVEVAKANPTDGTRMVAAIAGRELGGPVNRKRVQQIMRQHKLLQRSRNTDRRRRPGFFRVTRPDELWHIDIDLVSGPPPRAGSTCTSPSTAAPARSRAGGSICEPGLRRRSLASTEPFHLVGSRSGRITAANSRLEISAGTCPRGVIHRRGGYRDPESQAFIESWFGQSKKRCAWRAEWETTEQARAEIADYVQHYHHRPHSGIGYRTPTEVAATWRPDPETQMNLATKPTTTTGSTSHHLHHGVPVAVPLAIRIAYAPAVTSRFGVLPRWAG